jgi:hypothetical protein
MCALAPSSAPYVVRRIHNPRKKALPCAGYDLDGSGFRAVILGTDALPVAIEDQHVALPKLYGAPAYSRPARPVEPSPRPFDPDDLPIAAYQTDEERDMAESLAGRPYAPGGGAYIESNGQAPKHPPARPLSLRAIAGRLLGG